MNCMLKYILPPILFFVLAGAISAGDQESNYENRLLDPPMTLEQYARRVTESQIILALGGALALGMATVVVVRAIKKRRRPQFSLRWFILFIFALDIALYGGVRWWRTEKPDAEDIKWMNTLHETMEKKISFEFLDTPLSEAIYFLGSSIIMSPELAEKETPITLKVNNVARKDVIAQVCKLAHADWDIRNEAIFVYPEGKAPPLHKRLSPIFGWEAEAAKKLSRRVSFCCGGDPMTDLFRFLGEMANINIVFDPKFKNPDDVKLFIRFTDMRLENAITWFCLFGGAEWSLKKSDKGVGEIWITLRPKNK